MGHPRMGGSKCGSFDSLRSLRMTLFYVISSLRSREGWGNRAWAGANAAILRSAQDDTSDEEVVSAKML